MKWTIRKALINLLLIPTALVIAFKIAQGPKVTDNFAELAPNFYVLGNKDGGNYMLRLSDALGDDSYRYQMIEDSIRLDVGDVHDIVVIAENQDSQTIEFRYQNTYSSTSVYQVSNNQITPISYKINHGIGSVMLMLLALFIAMFLSKILVWVWRKKES